MRRQRPDPLVQHVDDNTFRFGRQSLANCWMSRKGARNPVSIWASQLARVGRVPLVALERTGVVHQDPERTQCRRRSRQQRRDLLLIVEIGFQHGRPRP